MQWWEVLNGQDRLIVRWIYGDIFECQRRFNRLSRRVGDPSLLLDQWFIIITALEQELKDLNGLYQYLWLFLEERNLLHFWARAIAIAQYNFCYNWIHLIMVQKTTRNVL